MNHSSRSDIPGHVINDIAGGKELSAAERSELEFILGASRGYDYPSGRTERNWKSLEQRITATPRMTVEKRPVRFAMFRWVAAAVVVLTVSLGIWQVAEYRAGTYSAVLASSSEVLGQKLPDGTLITLNAGTEVDVKAINRHKRVLELKKGEVFVSVQHNNVPFRLLTSRGLITVTGTEFAVNQQSGKPFSVFLKTGSIRFEGQGIVTELKPGQYLEEDAAGDLTVRTLKDNRAYAWMDNKLSFENAPLRDIISGLEKMYGVSFVYDEQLADRTSLTITFDKLSAEQAAGLLSKTLGSTVSVR